MTEFEVEKIVNFQSYAVIWVVADVATLMRLHLVCHNYPDTE